jgi:NSS family neurotransmitter:Na+ symporter
LPGGEHWIRLLFVMLFLLGIDSAFSFLEGTLTVLAETKLFYKAGRKKTAFVLATVAFLFSLMYATDAGLIFLDTIDYYISKSQCVLFTAMSFKYLTVFGYA